MKSPEIWLVLARDFCLFFNMITTEITDSLLALPEEDRIELARRLVGSVSAEHKLNLEIADGVRRIEDVLTGKVQAISEDEYRRILG